MAVEKSVPVDPAPTVNMTQLADAFASAMRSVQPVKEIKEGDPEYTARLHAEGFYDEFPHPVFQNGYQAQARGLSAEIREWAGTMPAGRYISGRLTVDVDAKGGRHFKYPNRDNDRIINREHWKDFPEMVTKAWQESHVAVPA